MIEHLAHASEVGHWNKNGGPLVLGMKAGASVGSVAGPAGTAIGAIAGVAISGLVMWNWAKNARKHH